MIARTDLRLFVDIHRHFIYCTLQISETGFLVRLVSSENPYHCFPLKTESAGVMCGHRAGLMSEQQV